MLSRNEVKQHCASSGSRRLHGRMGTPGRASRASKHAEPVRTERALGGGSGREG